VDNWEICHVYSSWANKWAYVQYFSPAGIRFANIQDLIGLSQSDYQKYDFEHRSCANGAASSQFTYLADRCICLLLSEGWEPMEKQEQGNGYGFYFKRKIN